MSSSRNSDDEEQKESELQKNLQDHAALIPLAIEKNFEFLKEAIQQLQPLPPRRAFINFPPPMHNKQNIYLAILQNRFIEPSKKIVLLSYLRMKGYEKFEPKFLDITFVNIADQNDGLDLVQNIYFNILKGQALLFLAALRRQSTAPTLSTTAMLAFNANSKTPVWHTDVMSAFNEMDIWQKLVLDSDHRATTLLKNFMNFQIQKNEFVPLLDNDKILQYLERWLSALKSKQNILDAHVAICNCLGGTAFFKKYSDRIRDIAEVCILELKLDQYASVANKNPREEKNVTAFLNSSRCWLFKLCCPCGNSDYNLYKKLEEEPRHAEELLNEKIQDVEDKINEELSKELKYDAAFKFRQ